MYLIKCFFCYLAPFIFIFDSYAYKKLKTVNNHIKVIWLNYRNYINNSTSACNHINALFNKNLNI